MKRLCLGLLLLGIAPLLHAQKSSSTLEQLDESLRGKQTMREEHYHPREGGAYTVNGSARYNRALYGAHTGFRMECSDWPIFGIYLPGMGGNLTFTPHTKICKATYTAGKMNYELSGIQIEAQVMREGEDVALWRIENVSLREQQIDLAFGGVSGQKFYRNGDLGVDDPDCFALKESDCTTNRYHIKGDRVVVDYTFKGVEKAVTLILPLDEHAVSPMPHISGTITLKPNEVRYIAYFPSKQPKQSQKALAQLFDKADKQRRAIAESFTIDTPAPWLNPIAPALAIAADGIWSGRTWLHGAVGWRTEHLGWRGAYVGSALGWHDRARTHFRTYADNMVRDVEPRYDHPRQDSTLNLARAEKKWGTPMYSNGYICRRPGKREMSHYDMNLVYVDALLRHIRATGDEEFMREMFPTLQLHLKWEKRNFDPDGDHLYDGYACIWASDALYYSGGKVTHSSAYNYFANREVARIAERIGEDPTPYQKEADAIYEAMHRELWDSTRERWGEYRETRGHERLHNSPGLWTLYHTMDSECNSPVEQVATIENWPYSYVGIDFPTISHYSGGWHSNLPATTHWQPYMWSINNVAIAEMMHTALAAWQAGEKHMGYHIMRHVAVDNMYYGTSPLNFGQLSYLDAARGECYRDFADPIGVWARALTEGLFGIRPDLTGREQRVTVQPGFPDQWAYGGITLPDIAYRMERDSLQTTYTLHHNYPEGTEVELIVEAKRLKGVTLNGVKVDYIPFTATFSPKVKIRFKERDAVIRIDYSGEKTEEKLISRPMRYISLREQGGHRYYGEPWYDIFYEFPLPREYYPDHTYRTVVMDSLLNADVTDIYRNRYLSNRPKNCTTLQIPTHGFSEWCHPTDTVSIDDSGLRRKLREAAIDDRAGKLVVQTDGVEIPFRLAHTGKNICYTSLWDNYPTSVRIPLEGKGYRLWLAMAGSTNPMQWGVTNGEVRVRYQDGKEEVMPLDPAYPEYGIRWSSIEADPYFDRDSFSAWYGSDEGSGVAGEIPLRILLKTGETKRLLGDKQGKAGMGSPYIDGGAAILMPFEIDPERTLESVELECLSNDVVIGLMGITIENNE